MSKVTIVIPTYNRGEQLVSVVEAIFKNDVSGISAVQVIVVDDSSAIPAENFIKNLIVPTPFTVQVLCQPNAGPGAARNNGLKNASGDIVIFIDDDVLVLPELIKKHILAHELHPGSIIIGSYPLLKDQKNTALLRWLNSLIDQPDMHTTKDHYMLTTEVASGNLSVERKDFEDGRLYYDHVKTPAAEEYELMARLQRVGKKIYFNPSITSWHLQPVTVRNKCMQEYKYGIGIAEVVMKVPEAMDYVYLKEMFNANHGKIQTFSSFIKRGIKNIFASKMMRNGLVVFTNLIEKILPFDKILFRLYRFDMGVFMYAGIKDGVKLYNASKKNG